jgi:2-methylisocitrate lyase-like PEP mutase family enzyme
MPKKCGHTPGRRVVSLQEAVRRIEVAVSARRSDDFLIVARTDARASLGLEEAIARARAFARAGADILFVEAPEAEEEFERIGSALADQAYLVANMVPSGTSPVIAAEKLKRYGYSIVIYPTVGMNAACAALEQAYRYLERHGSTLGSPLPSYTMEQMHTLVGFPEVWSFERQWRQTD